MRRMLSRVLRSAYLDRLAEEVNDKLQEAGLITLAELCKSHDLPGDFLSEVSGRRSQSDDDDDDDEDECVTSVLCVSYLRSCPSGSAASCKERWIRTTGASSSPRLSWPDTRPGYAGSSAPSQGRASALQSGACVCLCDSHGCLQLLLFLRRPTPVSSMIAAFGFQEHLLYSEEQLLHA